MESQYDDSLLATQENMENVDWDRVDGFGLVSEGKHLVEIENVSGYSHNFKEYTGSRAKLKMRVLAGPDAYRGVGSGDETLTQMAVGAYTVRWGEVPGYLPPEDQTLVLAGPDAGKFVYDDLNLPHRKEKAGNQNRRLLIASRLGLIEKGAKDNVGINWKLLEGRQAVVSVVHTKSEKDGKVYANITFDGYEGPESWQAQAASGAGGSGPDQWADI